MPAIPPAALDCVVYLYPDKGSASRGERAGGCGCIVSVPSKHEGFHFGYVVTNSHVIREGRSPVVRVNTRSGGLLIVERTEEYWIDHPAGDDISVLSIALEYETVKVKSIPVDWLATQEKINHYKVGPGDDIFMPGRFVSHEGKQRNIPAVRFGNISMLPYEPVRTGRGLLQDVFLVECRSLPGYSGSPVFLYTMPFSPIERDQPPPMLLGIDMGHIKDHAPILDKQELLQDKRVSVDDNWVVETNTGMSCVVPAWKIGQLLFARELEAIRKEFEDRFDKAKTSQPISFDVARAEEEPLAKAVFEDQDKQQRD